MVRETSAARQLGLSVGVLNKGPLMNQPSPITSTVAAASPHAVSADETIQALDVVPSEGLTSEQVVERTATFGPNVLAEGKKRPTWLKFVDQFNDTLVFILIGAAVISALVGDIKDPIVISIVLIINAVMGFVQESRADDALAALKTMIETVVRVRRHGDVQEVPMSELVPGDIVLLEAGDRVPADGRFILTSSTAVDESTLTGESLPVDKDAAAVLEEPAGETIAVAERINSGFMNTTLVRGRAEFIVTATGMNTEVGQLAGLLETADTMETPLQRQIDQLGKRLAGIAAIAVVIVFAVALFQADEINSESFSEALLGSVALAVAAIPEGLPAVVTVTLAVGVNRMAKQNAIVKRLSSVETLGSTTVICSDKTGTLTLNQMTATGLYANGYNYDITGLGYGPEGELQKKGAPVLETESRAFSQAIIAGVLCNDSHLRDVDGQHTVVGDPTEGALLVLAQKAGFDPATLRAEIPRIAEVPFDSASKFMATLHPDLERENQSYVVLKGAPDVVIDRCNRVMTTAGVAPLDETFLAAWHDANARFGDQGLRVLAVASTDLPAAPERFVDTLSNELNGLCLLALVGILDPARPEAIEAVAQCHAAGIDVKMITGDHASTAAAIANELGIKGRVVTGSQLDRLNDDELSDMIDDIGVCARVSPQHKVRMVQALQARDEVVAMTGDGVNDAASLKQAEIGVAMGITGTEVTKEAGDMILTDDNFATIVTAVERGRAIYDNIVTFVRFQLTTNISAILTILIGQLIGWGAIFTAIQILFVNIIADGPPAMSLGVDSPQPDVMQRNPRDPKGSILTGDRLLKIVFSGLVITAGTLLTFNAFNTSDEERLTAVTMAFTVFVFYQLVNSFCVRSGTGTVFTKRSLTNRTLLISLLAVVVAQVIVVQWSFMNEVFTTTPLTLQQWAIAIAVPFSLLIIDEVRKAVVRPRDSSTSE